MPAYFESDAFGNKVGDIRVFLTDETIGEPARYTVFTHSQDHVYYTDLAYEINNAGKLGEPVICLKATRTVEGGELIKAVCVQCGPNGKYSLWEEIADE